jgi:propanediol utilization protein
MTYSRLSWCQIGETPQLLCAGEVLASGEYVQVWHSPTSIYQVEVLGPVRKGVQVWYETLDAYGNSGKLSEGAWVMRKKTG